jgi:hypothetical protein
MSGWLSTILGGTKFLSNFIGGGAGSETNTSSSATGSQTSQTKQAGIEAAQSVGSANSQQFSDGFLKLLEQATAESLGRSQDSGQAISAELARQSGPNSFDADAYIRSTMAAAESALRPQTESAANRIRMASGGGGGNSATQLLESRIKNENAATLAGVRGDATARAAEIDRNRASTLTQLTTSLDANMSALLASLKGGETATTEKVEQKTTSVQEQNSSGTQSASQSGTESTPFNWAAGFGNLFAGIGGD